ncbi:MAG: Vms1/Ankzf1 family peptidyl-tRNA hydrolase [Actinomycetota bacterium]
MPEIDKEFLRRLAEWSADGFPVSSLYLDVDGRRYPRKQDYMLRAEELCHRLQRQAEGMSREAKYSVRRDASRFMSFLRSLERGRTRGLALFSSSGAGLWEEVLVPRPLPDRVTVADHPHVLPIEGLVETYESFCTALVDREKARIFLARMGRIREQTDIFDDVPGQHDQGGRAQARYQRHIEEAVAQHLKHVADVLLAFLKRRRFDHLILAGPEELLPELERGIHDYLRRRVVARTTLPITASADEVLERSLAVEEEVEAQRERQVLERLTAEARAGRHGVTGLEPVLDALNDGRVDTLVVPFGLSREGARCASCGRLAVDGAACPTCGGTLERVHDVVESAVAAALRQRSRVETLTMATDTDGASDIGALLRY